MASSSRDDMVLRPRLQGVSGAKPKSEQQRAIERALRTRSSLGRLIANQAKVHAARYAARTLAGAAQRSGIGRAVAGRATATAGAVVVAALVAARLISGKSFEGMGKEVETMILGDNPQEVFARRRTRQTLQQNEAAMQIAGRYGITDQMRQVGEKLYKLNLAEESGRRQIDREFPQNGTLDLLILRLRNMFTGAWESSGIPAKIEQVRETLEEGQMRSIPRIYK